ncbi:hypothetical protein GX441_09510, partial [bacterium]|nr:hypothetical protein [bacterium]
MKKLMIIVFLPMALFALERVNLIKNHSFEKEDSSWKAYTGTLGYLENDSAKAETRDSGTAVSGFYSAYTYTSSPPGDPTPPAIMRDSAVVIQGFASDKYLSDLDSL